MFDPLEGMWVMYLLRPRTLGRFVSHEPEMTECADGRGTVHTLYFDTRPFGIISPNRGGRLLTCARQVRKGELGRAVPIPVVDCIRQPFKEGEKPNVTKAYQRRRGQYGWVKLGDLAEVAGAGYDPDKWLQLVLDYWDFSRQREVGYPAESIVLKLARGSKLDIQAGTADVKLATREELQQERDPSELWVPRGFANTVLRLQALGYQPERV